MYRSTLSRILSADKFQLVLIVGFLSKFIYPNFIVDHWIFYFFKVREEFKKTGSNETG
jgi:hypothetical protein